MDFFFLPLPRLFFRLFILLIISSLNSSVSFAQKSRYWDAGNIAISFYPRSNQVLETYILSNGNISYKGKSEKEKQGCWENDGQPAQQALLLLCCLVDLHIVCALFFMWLSGQP